MSSSRSNTHTPEPSANHNQPEPTGSGEIVQSSSSRGRVGFVESPEILNVETEDYVPQEPTTSWGESDPNMCVCVCVCAQRIQLTVSLPSPYMYLTTSSRTNYSTWWSISGQDIWKLLWDDTGICTRYLRTGGLG